MGGGGSKKKRKEKYNNNKNKNKRNKKRSSRGCGDQTEPDQCAKLFLRYWLAGEEGGSVGGDVGCGM